MYYCNYTATVLLPFGVAAGDESGDNSRPVSLLSRFYGVEEDTVYVRNNYLDHNDCRAGSEASNPRPVTQSHYVVYVCLSGPCVCNHDIHELSVVQNAAMSMGQEWSQDDR